ncbi:MAG: hypothetical protein JHC99_07825 [Brevundimonas sp.]|nr:hypothetical protein [Brevundimonas sp.]
MSKAHRRSRVGRQDVYTRSDLRHLRQAVASTGPDTALEILIAVAHDVKVGAPISEIVEADDDQLGHAIAGAILRQQAFIARGAMVAAMTPSSKFRAYESIGDRAYFHLAKALELRPDDPLSLGVLASFAVEENREGKAASEALVCRSPQVPASSYCDVLQAWSAKWGGSQDEMWQCLKRLWRDDDPRSWAMLARAHFEEWLDRTYLRPAGNYATVSGAQSASMSLNEASDRALATVEDAGKPGLMRFVHGWLGRVYWDRRNLKRAKRHLMKTRSHMDPTIWIYGTIFMNADQRFRLAKLQCGIF